MSRSSIVIWISIIVLVLAGAGFVWWWYVSFVQVPSVVINYQPQNTQNANNVSNSPKEIKPGDTSDSSIDSVLSTVDSQIKNLDLDSEAINESSQAYK